MDQDETVPKIEQVEAKTTPADASDAVIGAIECRNWDDTEQMQNLMEGILISLEKLSY